MADDKDKRIAELEAKCDLHRLAVEDEEILRLRAEAERDQLAASLEAARKALERVRKTDYIGNHVNCACYICVALAQLAPKPEGEK